MKSETLTKEQQLLRENMYKHFFNEEMEKPLEYIIHLTHASDDQDLQRLRDEMGKEALASFWMLAELLARKKTKAYQVQTEAQWKRLSTSLEFNTVDECKEFIGMLAMLRLIDKHSFNERQTILNNRICRNAEIKAEDTASKKLKAWVMNEKKAGREV